MKELKNNLLLFEKEINSLAETLELFIFNHEYKSYLLKGNGNKQIFLKKSYKTFDENIKLQCYSKILKCLEDIINFLKEKQLLENIYNFLVIDSISDLENLIRQLKSVHLPGIFSIIHINKINYIINLSDDLLFYVEKYRFENEIFELSNNIWKNLYKYSWSDEKLKVELIEFITKINSLDNKYNKNYKHRSEYLDSVITFSKLINGEFTYSNLDYKDSILYQQHFNIWNM